MNLRAAEPATFYATLFGAGQTRLERFTRMMEAIEPASAFYKI